MRYTMLTGEGGGILDDLIVTNVGKYLFVVVNAARKEADIALLRAAGGMRVEPLEDRSLIALQGPAAPGVMARLVPQAASMPFMSALPAEIEGSRLAIMRSGYTGEDGYEISVPSGDAARIAELLLAEDEVEPAGLGARDSLRLEAGFCLYGHDIDESDDPGRSRACMDHRAQTPGGGWISRRRRHPRADARQPVAAAGRSRSRWPGAGPRRHGDFRHGRSRARQGHVRGLRAVRRRPGRHGVRRCEGVGPRHAGPAPGSRETEACKGAADAFRTAPILSHREGEMSDLRYSKEHEWVRFDGEIATVGISDFAQEQLGDVVFVELPAVGAAVVRNEEAAVVESVKAASEVYAPVSGEVVEVNGALEGDPALVNRSPVDEGWFMKIRASNPSEVEELMEEAAYSAFVAG